MKTTEGNKLIAEFMGCKILHKKYQIRSWNSSNEYYWADGDGEIVCDKDGNEVDDFNNEPFSSLEHLPYSESWDWLMPVVKKVTDLHDQFSYFHMGHIFDQLKDALYDARIKSAWNNIIELITWHNSQKS